MQSMVVFNVYSLIKYICYVNYYYFLLLKLILLDVFVLITQMLIYEGRSICNENRPVNPKVLYFHTS